MAWLLRIYSRAGRLLFVASSSAETYTERLRSLRHTEWWPLADPELTLAARVRESDVDRLLAEAVRTEKPMYYRTLLSEQPYLTHRPRGSDYIRRRRASEPLNRINERRGRA
jgi:hypothetical protein